MNIPTKRDRKMKIGITYDLRSWYRARGYSEEETAEFDREETVEAIEANLRTLGHRPERIGNIYDLVGMLASGKRWDLVFNIAECLHGDGRESAVPALLDQYRIPYVFSGPVVMGLSLNKYYTRLVAESAGVPVAPGTVLRHAEEVEARTEGFVFPLFLKPVAEGTGKGISPDSIVRNRTELRERCATLFKQYGPAILAEEYLPGREFTVGMVGSGPEARCIGAMEIVCRDNLPYCNAVKEDFERYVQYKLIEEPVRTACESVAKAAWVAINGFDAGRIDLRTDRNGRICFLEANPLAGLHPVDSDLPILCRLNGISYPELLRRIVEAALTRIGKP